MDGPAPDFGDDVPVTEFVIPRIPASAGALIGDGDGRILILKPTYKAGWTVPGGQIEEDGESPWEGCRREVLEETGLTVSAGRLVCVDFLRPKARRPGGLRFLFDCGSVGGTQKDGIVLQAEEIEEYRWAEPGGGGPTPERPGGAEGRPGAGRHRSPLSRRGGRSPA